MEKIQNSGFKKVTTFKMKKTKSLLDNNKEAMTSGASPTIWNFIPPCINEVEEFVR